MTRKGLPLYLCLCLYLRASTSVESTPLHIRMYPAPSAASTLEREMMSLGNVVQERKTVRSGVDFLWITNGAIFLSFHILQTKSPFLFIFRWFVCSLQSSLFNSLSSASMASSYLIAPGRACVGFDVLPFSACSSSSRESPPSRAAN